VIFCMRAETSELAYQRPRWSGCVQTALISVYPGNRNPSPAIATSWPASRIPRYDPSSGARLRNRPSSFSSVSSSISSICEMLRSSALCFTSGGTGPFHTIWALATYEQWSSQREGQRPLRKRGRSLLLDRAAWRVNDKNTDIDRVSRQAERHLWGSVWLARCPRQRKRGW